MNDNTVMNIYRFCATVYICDATSPSRASLLTEHGYLCGTTVTNDIKSLNYLTVYSEIEDRIGQRGKC